jgi:exportin-1
MLDEMINKLYSSFDSCEIESINRLLTSLKDHPDILTHCEFILKSKASVKTRFFILNILEEFCRFKLRALEPKHKEDLCTLIIDLIIKETNDQTKHISGRIFLNKLNVTLVQIIKHDLPQKWPNFLTDIITISQRSEELCENTMILLKLLVEEVSEFCKNEMTRAEIKDLKMYLFIGFVRIQELFCFVLTSSRTISLLQATLSALNSFLSCIPALNILNSKLIDVLKQLLTNSVFCNHSLSCLTEVFSHDAEERQAKSIETFYTFIIEFFYTRIIGQSFDIQMAYINGGQESINFFQNFSFFLSSFFKIYVNILERHIHIHCDLLNGLEMLIKLSYLKDIEIFKSCIDFWRNFAYELYIKHITTGISRALESEKDKSNQWQLLYGTVMRELRLFIIQNMTKPEEVFVTIDENRNVKREIFNNSSHDLDVLAQHKTMQETLKYLTYLNYVETHQIMIDKISLQLNEHDWARETLNTLCWAIGAISGSVGNLEAENKFLVSVIKYLLNLCEKVKGKDNKAVVASNIMYVVGQYPKFVTSNKNYI